MTSNNVLLLQCISYLSSSLHLQAATKHASIAIRQICCSCGIYFTPTLLKGIISSMEVKFIKLHVFKVLLHSNLYNSDTLKAKVDWK